MCPQVQVQAQAQVQVQVDCNGGEQNQEAHDSPWRSGIGMTGRGDGESGQRGGRVLVVMGGGRGLSSTAQ
jgi:hypothetical protein